MKKTWFLALLYRNKPHIRQLSYIQKSIQALYLYQNRPIFDNLLYVFLLLILFIVCQSRIRRRHYVTNSLHNKLHWKLLQMIA